MKLIAGNQKKFLYFDEKIIGQRYEKGECLWHARHRAARSDTIFPHQAGLPKISPALSSSPAAVQLNTSLLHHFWSRGSSCHAPACPYGRVDFTSRAKSGKMADDKRHGVSDERTPRPNHQRATKPLLRKIDL